MDIFYDRVYIYRLHFLKVLVLYVEIVEWMLDLYAKVIGRPGEWIFEFCVMEIGWPKYLYRDMADLLDVWQKLIHLLLT